MSPNIYKLDRRIRLPWSVRLMRYAIPAALALFLGWVLFTVIGGFLDMPEVRKSWVTHKCVEVLNADGSSGSCDDLPARYHNVWVE